MLSSTDNIAIQPISFLYNYHTTVDVLRLDQIHPVISGNKWFKLQEYLKDAKEKRKKILLTFGGAYSNHLIATAAAASLLGLKSIGIVRGEEALVQSHTLEHAKQQEMDLFFISREDYKSKVIPPVVYDQYSRDEVYIISEGGYGVQGRIGAESILHVIDTAKYTHIITAVGTGTTMAGLVTAAGAHQNVIGISVLKNNFSITEEIQQLLPTGRKFDFTINDDYHFGGYAKYSADLIRFINDFYQNTFIPTDFVYTGKLFYAVDDMIRRKYFPEDAKLLIIHSGGLQGNKSLPNRTLIF